MFWFTLLLATVLPAAPKGGFGQRTVVAQILTSPGHLVTVPKVTGAIRFEKAGQ